MTYRVETTDMCEIEAIVKTATECSVDLSLVIRALTGIDEITSEIINDARRITKSLTANGFTQLVVNELRQCPEIDLRYCITALKHNTLMVSYQKDEFHRAFMFTHLLNWVNTVGNSVCIEMDIVGSIVHECT